MPRGCVHSYFSCCTEHVCATCMDSKGTGSGEMPWARSLSWWISGSNPSAHSIQGLGAEKWMQSMLSVRNLVAFPWYLSVPNNLLPRVLGLGKTVLKVESSCDTRLPRWEGLNCKPLDNVFMHGHKLPPVHPLAVWKQLVGRNSGRAGGDSGGRFRETKPSAKKASRSDMENPLPTRSLQAKPSPSGQGFKTLTSNISVEKSLFFPD
jgi:hypothetical protein